MNAIPMTPELVRGVLPPRPRDGHKGTFGTAALLCGGRDYPGAALLAAEACLRMGAGKTVLVAPSAVLSLALTRTPELLARPWYREVSLCKYVALIIDTLNHDESIYHVLNPGERIKSLLARHEEELKAQGKI